MIYIGIDIGSSFTKYCFVDENRMILEKYVEKTPIQQKKYFDNKIIEINNKYPDSIIATCGYGKDNIILSAKRISELTALALGVNEIVGKNATILDIGGQDTKLIYQENGQLKKFFLNDKCAAGCGRFLYNTLELLRTDFEEIELKLEQKPVISLSSVCAVFAQTEIVELLAKDYPARDIINAVIWQILSQSKVLLNKIEHNILVLSGGLSKIDGINFYAQKAMGCPIYKDQFSPYYSAFGCALYIMNDRNEDK